LCDDLNTPILIAQLYETIYQANLMASGKASLTAADLQKLQAAVKTMVFEVLGIKIEAEAATDKVDGLVQMLLQMRVDAKNNQDWGTSDRIRDQLAALGIQVKDSKEGSSWSFS
jgi:cysteinyl-tRNA synthetase